MHRNKRRRTIWADPDPAPEPDSHQMEVSTSPVGLAKMANAVEGPVRQVHDESPWNHYEAGAEVFCGGREVTLARHRGHKKGLVHVQCLKMDRSSVGWRIKAIDQCKHPSFPVLLDVYTAGEHCFLVWEPVEFSVQHLLDIELRLADVDIAQIIRPVLEGIRFLRDQGLALATLSPDIIMLTEDGNVKIMGVEESCRISHEDMHADTLKLTALAVTVEKLMDRVTATMQTWEMPHSWGPEISSFLHDLTTKPLDDLLKDPFLPPPGIGALRWLATAANKEVRHDLKRLNADGVRYSF
ncbi:hypothetical protein NYO67_4568 [Aspergillus flavus]|nr:hypothetical protein NYO67_4568 [Aspergillus flavus]